jgi:hypothetical protein
MRQETNKEIDLLLRRLSRQDGEAVRDAETQLDDRHLDADELSSYAQNVAPPKARARYIEHLADCSTCRRTATELSLALGVALGVATAAAPVETVPAAGGLKKFLSSLFSPMVLRYAVPALGVIVVMVIGVVLLRQRADHEAFVAKVDGQAVTAPVPSSEPTAPPLSGVLRDDQSVAAKPGIERGLHGETAAGRAAGPVESKEGATAGTADTPAAPSAPVTVARPSVVQPLAERSVSELPVVSPTPLASLSPKANITTDGTDTGETKKKEIVAKRDTQPAVKTAEAQTAANEKEQAKEPPREAAARPAKSVAADRVDQSKAKPDSNTVAPAGGAGGGGRVATRRRAEESKDDAETRSVAGRKFRRDDGIWTDTAYDSSTRTVNMARGSEQFRALVADEPAIGTIAEQLDGVVIVVWKGRAYRIR